ncbi:hypothetical protein O181_002994 [Austropuccinia psidii MF-1]|uniref:Uncharacterized protein n=1 Tax=Austropuccinia psidii MF-1 TaxID=1389203 RepID=A0A9Q3BDI1_9BASI|nr:hypothetical protein [Austropuccinia psidii MF-1]
MEKFKDLRIKVQNLDCSTTNILAVFQEKLEKHDKERLQLKEDIHSNIYKISFKNELQRKSTPILNINVLNWNNDLNHTISKNAEVEIALNTKDIPCLEEWLTSSGEGKYNHMEFMREIYILKEYFNIQEEYITATLKGLFTK